MFWGIRLTQTVHGVLFIFSQSHSSSCEQCRLRRNRIFHAPMFRCIIMQPPTRSPFTDSSKDDRDLLKHQALDLNPCQEAQMAIIPGIKKSQWVRNAALQFIQAEFGNESFVAVHVRPYADDCVQLWASASEPSIEQLSPPTCKNGGMFASLVPTVREVMARHSLQRLFLMSHPKIRWRIDKMFSKVWGSTVQIHWFSLLTLGASVTLCGAQPHRSMLCRHTSAPTLPPWSS